MIHETNEEKKKKKLPTLAGNTILFLCFWNPVRAVPRYIGQTKKTALIIPGKLTYILWSKDGCHAGEGWRAGAIQGMAEGLVPCRAWVKGGARTMFRVRPHSSASAWMTYYIAAWYLMGVWLALRSATGSRRGSGRTTAWWPSATTPMYV